MARLQAPMMGFAGAQPILRARTTIGRDCPASCAASMIPRREETEGGGAMRIIAALCGATIALLGTAGLAPAQTADSNPDLAKVIAAARQEGRLLLRSTTSVNGAAEGAKLAQDGIKRMFGVDLAVEWVPGPAFAPLAAALYQEKQAGQPASGDVYIATAIQITPYLERGLFSPVDWIKLAPARIKPDYVEGGG